MIAGVEFIAVPGGEFAMGDDSDLAEPSEQPVHTVRLDAYWMARTELITRRRHLTPASADLNRSGS